jgi:hypothetical protein
MEGEREGGRGFGIFGLWRTRWDGLKEGGREGGREEGREGGRAYPCRSVRIRLPQISFHVGARERRDS